MKKFVGLVVMLALVAGTANADTTLYTGTNVDVIISTPVSVGSAEDLVSFTLSLVGKNGWLPNTFDSSNDGARDANQGGILAETDVLHQENVLSLGNPVQSPTTEYWTNQSVTPPDWDSYWLIADMNDWAIKYAPGETFNLASSTQPELYGMSSICNFGDRLYGSFAYSATYPTSNVMAFANICVPNGTVLTLDFTAAGVGPGGSFAEYIPEPATVALLSLGGVLGLLRRKRG